MNQIFSKLRDFVGLNDQVEYEEYYEDGEVDSNNYQQPQQQQPQQQPGNFQQASYQATNFPQANYQNFQEPSPQPVQQETPAANRRWREPVNTMETDVAAGSKVMSNVIGMPGAINGISEVLVLEPRTFEEMPQAIQALRERKSVVLNLTIMDPDQAQRAVDFVAGGTYALDGHQERIGESIFLFTPSCVQVSTQGGVLHEVPQPPVRAPRSVNTNTWNNEVNRAAQ